MRRIFAHVKTYIFRGILVSIPFVLTILVIRLLYLTIDKRIAEMLVGIIGFRIPGIGIALLLAALYMLGLIGSNVIGRKVFSLIERLTTRVPLVRTTYKVGRQFSSTLSLPQGEVFKRAVLLEYLKPGMWTIGFVTGTVVDKMNGSDKLLKVFVPTSPNPMSGVMVIVNESQTRDPGWTIEESIRSIISGGIIGPEEIGQPHRAALKEEDDFE
jgi:uncharacterized membrane protein